MINKALLVTFFVLAAISVTAQKPLTEDAIEKRLLTPYDNYFAADREMIYTQFNKSRYITGDDIWFTSWVLNPVNKRLSFKTTKLYVELWSAEKKIVSRKILLVKAGTASNFIHIEDSLAPGTYCFRAYTNWMRNFYDEKEFNSQITVLGPTGKSTKTDIPVHKGKKDLATKSNDTIKPLIKPDFDIQFLPESGHFIEGIDNVIGFKVTDPYGRGVLVKGKVVDSTNNEMLSFTTNKLGMTNFTIANASSQTFRSIIELPNGSKREIKLPKTERQGVAINVNSYLPDVVWVRLQINELTRSLNQSYFLMIHANGVMFNNYKIGFSTSPSVQFRIKKKDLGNGIIYATLFNEHFTPVAERIFYNQRTTQKGNLSLSATAMSNDTIKLTVTATDSLSKAEVAKLSLSVLPEGTSMNDFQSNFQAESLLRPALKGDIENARYYFEKKNTERAIAIDNLLLTQGWRKYDWPEIAKNNNKFVYPSEVGFTINGGVKNWLKNKPEVKSRISLISPKNNLFLFSMVDSVGEFKFPELFLVDSSNIIASASSAKGANWNRVLQMAIPEAELTAPVFNQILSEPLKEDEIEEDIPNMTKEIIQLREIVITAQKKNLFAGDMYVGMMSRQFVLTKDNYMQYTDIEQVLMRNFNVMVKMDGDGQYQFNMGRGGTQKPILTIDGTRVGEPIEILSFPLNLVEAIAVDKSGTSMGIGGGGGVIAIVTRKTPLFTMNTDATNMKRLLVKGYTAPKEYFEPRYLVQPENPDFAKYASIYWKSELVTDSTGVASFKFKVSQPLKSLVIRAEGINFYGLIFLHEEMLVLPKRD